jgi:prepilin-type N-terminal cleavage/methylation domain-containing protein
MTRQPRRNGYTLLEMVLVTALIGILAALSYPAIDSMYNGQRLDAGVDAVEAAWAQARSRAIHEGRNYRFAVVLGQGNYRIAPDLPDYWSGVSGGDPTALVREGTLPRGVTFASPEDGLALQPPGGQTALPEGSVGPEQWVPVAVFKPDGSAEADAHILFQSAAAAPKELSLRGITGAVSVRRVPEGN